MKEYGSLLTIVKLSDVIIMNHLLCVFGSLRKSHVSLQCCCQEIYSTAARRANLLPTKDDRGFVDVHIISDLHYEKFCVFPSWIILIQF